LLIGIRLPPFFSGCPFQETGRLRMTEIFKNLGETAGNPESLKYIYFPLNIPNPTYFPSADPIE